MDNSDDMDCKVNDLSTLASAIESNMENLRTMRERADNEPEYWRNLEIALEAQTELLNSLSLTTTCQTDGKPGMGDFVRGKCKAATQHHSFISLWYDTSEDPCLKCGADKSKCGFHKVLEGSNTGTNTE
jgi:hypothetical protein